MKKFARIENDRVMEILEAPELPDFHPSLVWVEAPADVQEQWSYTAGKFNAPEPDPVPEYEPTETEVRLAAIEAKLQITDADKQAAREALVSEKTGK